MMESVICPNTCGELVTSRNKRVEFQHGNEEIELEIRIEWCPTCKFVWDVIED